MRTKNDELVERLERELREAKDRQRRENVPQGYCDLPTIADFLISQAGQRDYGQIAAGASADLRKMAAELRKLEDRKGPGL